MALKQVLWKSVVCTSEMHGGSIFTLLSTYSDALCFVSTRYSISIILANHKSIPLRGVCVGYQYFSQLVPVGSFFECFMILGCLFNWSSVADVKSGIVKEEVINFLQVMHACLFPTDS